MDEELDISTKYPSNHRQFYKTAMFIHNNVLSPFLYLNVAADSNFQTQHLLGYTNKLKRGIWQFYYKPEFGSLTAIEGNTEQNKQKSAKIKIKNFLDKYLNCTNEFSNMELNLSRHIKTKDNDGYVLNTWIENYES